MSQRESDLQREMSQSDAERWASLGINFDEEPNADDDDNDDGEGPETQPVERLHSRSASTRTKSTGKSQQPSSQAGKASSSKKPTTKSQAAPSSQSSIVAALHKSSSASLAAPTGLNLDSVLARIKAEEGEGDSAESGFGFGKSSTLNASGGGGGFDVAKFLADEAEEEADSFGSSSKDDQPFSAQSFLATLTAATTTPSTTTGAQGKPTATTSSVVKAEEEADESLGFEDEGNLVIPLQDESLAIPENLKSSKQQQQANKKSGAAKKEPQQNFSLPAAESTVSAKGGVNYVQKAVKGAQDLSITKSSFAVKKEEPRGASASASPHRDVSVPNVAQDAASAQMIYWTDAREQPSHFAVDPGSVFLFGKVPVVNDRGEREYHSCCVRVRNIVRCVMVLPQDNVEAGDVVQELAVVCARQKIRNFRMKVVDRYYAFEEDNVPRDKRRWIKLRYPGNQSTIFSATEATRLASVRAVLGANRSLLELFLIKRKFKGPSFVHFKNWTQVTNDSQKLSHCRYEFTVDEPKDVVVMDGGTPPLLHALSIQLHTQLDASGAHNEVFAVSLASYKTVHPDGNAVKQEASTKIGIRPFSAQSPLPLDLEKYCVNKGFEPDSVRRFFNEQSLLQWTANTIRELDPDILLGHNFSAFTLDVLLHRYHAHGTRGWSSLGRLDLLQFPKLQSGAGGTTDSNQHERDVCIGRLVVDTYLLAKEYHKSSSYKLLTLAQQLKLEGIFGVTGEDVPNEHVVLTHEYMTHTASLFELLSRSLNNSVLAAALAFKLDVIPLTKRLCSLAGNLWSRTLGGSRAERIEYLLLHAFHALKFVTPDKKSYEAIANMKRKLDADDGGDGDADGEQGGGTGRRRGPAKYKGGMVLEPKSGLYTDYVLLLDFNSLYPSLIQEFNICFTTVERGKNRNRGAPSNNNKEAVDVDRDAPAEDEEVRVPPPEALICDQCNAVGAMPPCPHKCVLPRVIKSLVDSRREVKKLMQSEKDPSQLAQYEIRQKALKLTANSMYGCLGFEYSRFYAQPLAELVTREGREALKRTIDLVPLIQSSFSQAPLSVLYGDTDSVMVRTSVMDSLSTVRDIAREIKQRVNKHYKCLEIDIDGIFRSILLHKKKKYAALLVVDWAGEGTVLKKEVKGLDMVRRDWCPVSQNTCDIVLNRLLRNEGGEDLSDSLVQYMSTVAARVREGTQYTLDDYVISKSLTKEPESYKGTSFPHATVAMRMKERHEPVRVGDLIPYVICLVDNLPTNSPLSARAFHVEEARRQNLRIDAEWYIETQIYPPLMRICEHIQGFSVAQMAESMGIKVHVQADDGAPGSGGRPDETSAESQRASFANLFKSLDLEECFPTATPLEVSCPKCSGMTPIRPHHTVAQLGAQCEDDPETIRRNFYPMEGTVRTFPLYSCMNCRRPLDVWYVANCMTGSLHAAFRKLYQAGGTRAAVRQLRDQISYFRAAFDVPKMPGCPDWMKRLHRECALRCLTPSGELTTLAQMESEHPDAVDPVLSAVLMLYSRVDHLFVDVGSLISEMPVRRAGGN
jgi:DNA polymerase alpha subunit A